MRKIFALFMVCIMLVSCGEKELTNAELMDKHKNDIDRDIEYYFDYHNKVGWYDHPDGIAFNQPNENGGEDVNVFRFDWNETRLSCVYSDNNVSALAYSLNNKPEVIYIPVMSVNSAGDYPVYILENPPQTWYQGLLAFNENKEGLYLINEDDTIYYHLYTLKDNKAVLLDKIASDAICDMVYTDNRIYFAGEDGEGHPQVIIKTLGGIRTSTLNDYTGYAGKVIAANDNYIIIQIHLDEGGLVYSVSFNGGRTWKEFPYNVTY